jgi:outer membrane protein OmpA-like peptidoglycan-associated protein
MTKSMITKVLLLLVLAAFLLAGCSHMEYAPKYSYWYYHKELPEADRAIEKAKAAGKDRECPDEFNKAAKMRDDAYETYLSCHTKEGIEMALKATKMAGELCPPKPPVAQKVKKWKEVAKITLVNFATDKSNIEAKYSAELQQAIAFATKYPDSKIDVDGHTDNKGSKQYNDALSMRRANTVAKYLEQHGVSQSRIKANGFGFSQPVDTNDTAAGRAKNRRVEIRISAQVEVDSDDSAPAIRHEMKHDMKHEMKHDMKKMKKTKKVKKADKAKKTETKP